MLSCLLRWENCRGIEIPLDLDIPVLKIDQRGGLTTQADPKKLEGQDLIMILPLFSGELLNAGWRTDRLLTAMVEIRRRYGQQALLYIVLGVMTEDHGNHVSNFLDEIETFPSSRLLVVMDKYMRDGPRSTRETSGAQGDILCAVNKIVELSLHCSPAVLGELVEWRHDAHPCLIRCVGAHLIRSGASSASQAAAFEMMKTQLLAFMRDPDTEENDGNAFLMELEPDIEKLIPTFDLLSHPNLDDVRNDLIFSEKQSALKRFDQMIEAYEQQAKAALLECHINDHRFTLQNGRLNIRERLVQFVNARLAPGFGIKSVRQLLHGIQSATTRRFEELRKMGSPREDLNADSKDSDISTTGLDDASKRFAELIDKRPPLVAIWLWCFAGLFGGLLAGYGSYRFIQGGISMLYRPIEFWILGAAGGGVLYLSLVAMGAITWLITLNRKKIGRRVRLPLRMSLFSLFALGGMFLGELSRSNFLTLTGLQSVLYPALIGLCIMLLFVGIGFYRYARKWIAWERDEVAPYLGTLAQCIEDVQAEISKCRDRVRDAALTVIKHQILQRVDAEAKAAQNRIAELSSCILQKVRSVELARDKMMAVFMNRASAGRIVTYSDSDSVCEQWGKQIKAISGEETPCALRSELVTALLSSLRDEIRIEHIVANMIDNPAAPKFASPVHKLPPFQRLDFPNGIYAAHTRFAENQVGGNCLTLHTPLPDGVKADEGYTHLPGEEVSSLGDVQFGYFFFDRWLPGSDWKEAFADQIRRLATGDAA